MPVCHNMAIWLLRAAEGHARLQVAFAAVSKQFAAGKVSGKKTFVQDRPLEKRLGDWNFQLTTCQGQKPGTPELKVEEPPTSQTETVPKIHRLSSMPNETQKGGHETSARRTDDTAVKRPSSRQGVELQLKEMVSESPGGIAAGRRGLCISTCGGGAILARLTVVFPQGLAGEPCPETVRMASRHCVSHNKNLNILKLAQPKLTESWSTCYTD